MKAFREVHRFLLHISLALVLGLSGCGKEATGPEDIGGTEPPPQPPPATVTVGALLQGNQTVPAVGSLTNMMPTPAPDGEILGDLLASRLQAVLDPSATVAEVNAALVAQDVGIISMLEGHPFITLAMPPVASEAEAEALAAALKASGAFDHVSPAFEFFLEPDDDPGMAATVDRIPPPTSANSFFHWEAIRLPAAWNAKALAPTGVLPVTVVVPDSYWPLTPHEEIDCLRFVGGTPETRESHGRWRGNHGFMVAGVIGADFDGDPSTGTSPDPRNLLDIRAFARRGLTFPDLFRHLYHEVFPWGSPFVLNLSNGYVADQIRGNRLSIAFDALELRRLLADVQDQLLIVNAVGNYGRNPDVSGDARFDSTPGVAHSFADLSEVFAGTGVSSQDSLNFVDHMDWTYIEKPEAAAVLNNVLLVGSSDPFGAESPSSSRNSHLRAVGRRVWSTCAFRDSGFDFNQDMCDGTSARGSGTSYAAPAIAGLAAYLWNLDPTLSVNKVRRILLHAYNESNRPGLVDAYIAVLSLDTWPEAGVRRTLLDVAGDTPEAGSNGRFDENDIELFMDQWAAPSDPFSRDWSRYDLNGDGFTGGSGTVRFDLSMDWPPDFRADLPTMLENEVVHFDERAVSDCDVLRYYAYTTIYEGDEDRRRVLLLPCAGIDLGLFTNLGVRVDINAVFEEPNGPRTDVPGFSMNAGGEGSSAGGVLDYTIAGTNVNPLTTETFSGHITGLIDADGGRISQLQASFQREVTLWEQWSQTDTWTVVLEDVPLTTQSEDFLWYKVAGPESCASIVSVSAGSTWTTGSWALVDFFCGPSSQVWIQLMR